MILEGRYHIENELGRGGFGAVFKALDLRLNKPVAVKENLDASPEAQRQFAREATVLANLAHPNLPRVIDHFSVPDQGQYLVMDFVAGEDLNTMIERDKVIPLEPAVSWAAQVADALDYLHSQQPPILHRDVKPANIRITRSSGPHGRAMLVDFGLVKYSDPSVKTTMGARAITPGYAPPEQYGVGYTDTRTDIYALGATLYAAVTGREPVESVQRMTGMVVLPASTVDPNIPAALSRAIDRAMALEPDQRYQSAADFRAALQACLIEIRGKQAGAGAFKSGASASDRPETDAASGPVFALDSAPASAGVQPAAPHAEAAAYVDAPRQSRPVSRPAPSQPVSRPAMSGGKKALSVGAIVAVVVCLLAVGGGYALFASFSGQASAGATATVRAQATAMFKLAGTSTVHAALLHPALDLSIEVLYPGQSGAEHVRFRYSGLQPLLLNGWVLEDSQGNRYAFPEITLNPEAEIAIHTGEGTDTASDLYWGLDETVWTPGELLTLRDAHGNIYMTYQVPQ
jgi:serine/threonine-protein kinase